LALVEHYRNIGMIVDVYMRKTADLSLEEDIMRISHEISESDYDVVIFSA